MQPFSMANEIKLIIEDLGAHGDGVARIDGVDVFVPYTLPGERVLAEVRGGRGELCKILSRAAHRIDPVCEHFHSCGGCSLQHLEQSRYLEWKRDRVRAAFASRGLEADVLPVLQTDLHSRRRAVLAARRARGEVVLGFHSARSHDVVDVRVCPVLAPELVCVLSPLRALLADLFVGDEELRVHVLAANNGIDIAISGTCTALPSKVLTEVSARAADLPVIRLSVDGELLYRAAEPYVCFGSAQVAPPPGVFLQASRQAEDAICELVVGALPKRAKNAADLFCGLGALSFPLAERVGVCAVDNDGLAVNALNDGQRWSRGLKRIDGKVRDLFQEPLSRKELEPFDLVVFDPPRAGAREQAEAIAKSNVPVVVGVSCNPATLARDARILVDGGYSLTEVTPIDQFVYSAHIEAVAVFRR